MLNYAKWRPNRGCVILKNTYFLLDIYLFNYQIVVQINVIVNLDISKDKRKPQLRNVHINEPIYQTM